MPLYEYECDDHGGFTLVRPMAQAGESGPCPACSEPGRRTISAPTLMTMSPLKRQAAARNEKSRHEPGVRTGGVRTGGVRTGGVRTGGSGHGHVQGRGAGSAGRSGEAAKPKLQTYTGPRPWVMEHR